MDLASKSRIPAMWGHRQFVETGGLMSYAANHYDQLRRADIYVDISKHVGRVNGESIVVDESAA